MTWYDLGTLEAYLEGKNTIRFNLGGEQADTKRFAAIDCFVLSKGNFHAELSVQTGRNTHRPRCP